MHSGLRSKLIGLCLLGPFYLACLWDTDTLEMEKQAFPEVAEIIAGDFLMHSEAFYQWRIQDRQHKLSQYPDSLALMDDLAVAYDKTGHSDQAIALMQQSIRLSPDRYETQANLGTFLIHAGKLTEGLAHIKRAIEINPDAHFGREIYQQYLVEYVLEKQAIGMKGLPLSREWQREMNNTDSMLRVFGREPITSQEKIQKTIAKTNFLSFLKSRFLKRRVHRNEFDLNAAVKGILGMMRFGNHRSPVLLEALGDVLMDIRNGQFFDEEKAARQLAARAYLKASWEVQDSTASAQYRYKAKEVMEIQQRPTFEALEAELKAEVAQADAHIAEIAAKEAKWIAEQDEPEENFNRHYYTYTTYTTSWSGWWYWLIGGLIGLAILYWVFRR